LVYFNYKIIQGVWWKY